MQVRRPLRPNPSAAASDQNRDRLPETLTRIDVRNTVTDTAAPLWPEGLSDISVFTVVSYPSGEAGGATAERAAGAESSTAELMAGVR